ncbi:MAG: YjfB family protein, partial [Lachnospiraceae bacterium]
SCDSSSLSFAVGVTMLDKEMEWNETLNTQLIRSMEQSVTPHLGQSIDIRI